MWRLVTLTAWTLAAYVGLAAIGSTNPSPLSPCVPQSLWMAATARPAAYPMPEAVTARDLQPDWCMNA
jgi:hypothetical protein